MPATISRQPAISSRLMRSPKKKTEEAKVKSSSICASAAGSLLADLQVGGVSKFNITKAGVVTLASGNLLDNSVAHQLGFSTSAGVPLFKFDWTNNVFGVYTGSIGFGAFAGSIDLKVWRDAANTLALRNGTSAQAFNIYNTYTDASNYERAIFDWQGSANVLTIGTENAGTGSARNMRFVIGGASKADYGITFAGWWNFNANAFVNGAFQASGRVESTGAYLQTTASAPGGNGGLYIGANGGLTSNAAGVFTLSNNAGTDVGRLNFGGTTSSFPALKRSTTTLQARLADDSAYATLDAIHRLQGAAPATAGDTGTAGDIRYDSGNIYICTAANTWKRVAVATF